MPRGKKRHSGLWRRPSPALLVAQAQFVDVVRGSRRLRVGDTGRRERAGNGEKLDESWVHGCGDIAVCPPREDSSVNRLMNPVSGGSSPAVWKGRRLMGWNIPGRWHSEPMIQ